MQPQVRFPRVSILIPVLNEIRHLSLLLSSIEKQTYPKDLLEVILLDGGSTDGSVAWMEENLHKYPFNVRVVDNPRRYQSPGLNLGLKEATGEIIVRLDAHAVYDFEYVQAAVSVLMSRPEVVNVGGTQTAVGTNTFSRAAALAMNSPIGVGGASFRYATTEQEVDTVFLGAWRSEELVKAGGWSEDWIINEDGELNLRIKRILPDRLLLVTPAMKVHYHPRSSVSTLAKQYYRYGFWRQKTFNQYPEAMRLSHLAPVILVLGLAVSLIVGSWPGFAWFWLIPVLYLLALLACGMALAAREAAGTPGAIAALCLGTMHTSWGIGALAGFWHYGFPGRALLAVGRQTLLRKEDRLARARSLHQPPV